MCFRVIGWLDTSDASLDRAQNRTWCIWIFGVDGASIFRRKAFVYPQEGKGTGWWDGVGNLQGSSDGIHTVLTGRRLGDVYAFHMDFICLLYPYFSPFPSIYLGLLLSV